MAILFKREGVLVVPTDEALLLSPFKDIWERDETPKKAFAMREFAYIEFMTSQLKENMFRNYPEDKKEKAIVKALFKEQEETWSPCPLVQEGLEFVIHFQEEGSDDYEFLQTAILTRKKLSNFLNTFELNQRSNEGKGPLLLKPKDVTNALLDVDKVTISLMNLRIKVSEQVTDAVKTKGEKTISEFANPESLNSLNVKRRSSL